MIMQKDTCISAPSVIDCDHKITVGPAPSKTGGNSNV